VIAIVAITALFGFLQGVLFGLVASCAIFAIDLSRIGVVRRLFALNERPSIVVRSIEEMRILADNGSKVQIIELSGFIFFGSAYRLQDQVKKLVADKRPEVLVFDFSAVSGADSSAGMSFSQFNAYLHQAAVRRIVVGLPPDAVRTFNILTEGESAPEFLANLDDALEVCEERILARHPQRARMVGALEPWLSDALGTPEMARKFIFHLKPATILDGDILCRQGDPSYELLFIERGRVTVTVERPAQAPLRVRVFDPHTIVGEIGFFLQTPRTATVRIEKQAVVWALDQETFGRMKQAEPDLVAALLALVVQMQAERLSFTTRQVSVVHR
jgi:sulfate permease, SulP family